jgi:UDP-N-acetylglucosamine--N-acetylmuramyl-(pentapeptide) pyrophosphoryl-undecaprenol N-acetylglucosamine transferase
MRVVVAGGGTAGHVYPGLSLASALRRRGHDVVFAGTERGLEARLAPAAGFPFRVVRAKPFPRKLSFSMLAAPAAAVAALRECTRIVAGVDVVVGMGGYVSVPPVLAARRSHVPVVLHEQNAVPGLANRALSRLAGEVALTFAEARRYFPKRVRVEVTGDPVREEILRVPEDRDTLAKEAQVEFGLDEGRKTVVMFGGSQGALHVDRAAVGACRLLADRTDLQVVLVTGPAHLDVIRRGLGEDAVAAEVGSGSVRGVLRAGGPGGILVRLAGYVERMELLYACADLVVARAGATTIAELSVCGIPALLVPYPYATGRHQEANARALQRAGGASVVLDEQLSGPSLASRIESLIDHDDRLETMARGSRSFGRPDAADRVADVVERVGGGSRKGGP